MDPSSSQPDLNSTDRENEGMQLQQPIDALGYGFSSPRRANNELLASDLEPSSNNRGRTPPPSTDPLFSGQLSSQADYFQTPSSSQRRVARRNDVGLNPGIAQFFANYSENDMDERGISKLSSQMDGIEKVRVVWGTTIQIAETISAFKDFLVNFTPGHRKLTEGQEMGEHDMIPLYPRLLQQIHETEVFNMNLDCMNLKCFQPTLTVYYELIRYPQEIIPLMDIVVNEYYKELYQINDNIPQPIQVRPFNIGKVVNMRELNPADIDQLVTIKGLVIRTSNIIPDMRMGFFKCLKCNYEFEVDNVKGVIQEPSKCPRKDCDALHSLSLIHNRCQFNDKQIVRVQETPDCIPDGQTPHTITMCAYDSLVDVARPGDRVEITGIFRAAPVRINPRQRRIKNIFRTFIDIVHLKRSDKNRLAIEKDAMTAEEFVVSYEEGDNIKDEDDSRYKDVFELAKCDNLYERLMESIAPSVWEMDNVKKALLLQLFGGVSKTLKKCGNVRFRGDINVLLAGDPGVSKSQLLQYVHKLAPRGMYTSGKGSSAVGLTAYVTRDPETKQFVLESGALVLSDGGICCIDEFDKMSDATRAILHEVMEQQTVSVAKAGIITTLNARTSVLASANPIDSKYNMKKSIVENLNLPPTLLSRFDIIALILDNPNEQMDRRLGKHIVSLYLNEQERKENSTVVDVKLLTKYISYARSKINPVLTEEAMGEITNGYVQMRHMSGGGSGKTISATTRQLESIIRLSEGHARMRLSHLVQVEDVKEAIRIIKDSILSYAIDPITGRIDMDVIMTGKSSAVREQVADLKKEVKDFLASKNIPTLDFQMLSSEMAKQSSIKLEESLLRNVLDELVDEEFIHVTGKRGNVIIRRLV